MYNVSSGFRRAVVSIQAMHLPASKHHDGLGDVGHGTIPILAPDIVQERSAEMAYAHIHVTKF